MIIPAAGFDTDVFIEVTAGMFDVLASKVCGKGAKANLRYTGRNPAPLEYVHNFLLHIDLGDVKRETADGEKVTGIAAYISLREWELIVNRDLWQAWCHQRFILPIVPELQKKMAELELVVV